MKNPMKVEDFGQPEPRWHATILEREGPKRISLQELLRTGIWVPATHGPRIQVMFQASEPFVAREGTGFKAVKVRSNFGGESTLLLEPEAVSGFLRLRR